MEENDRSMRGEGGKVLTSVRTWWKWYYCFGSRRWEHIASLRVDLARESLKKESSAKSGWKSRQLVAGQRGAQTTNGRKHRKDSYHIFIWHHPGAFSRILQYKKEYLQSATILSHHYGPHYNREMFKFWLRGRYLMKPSLNAIRLHSRFVRRHRRSWRASSIGD